MRRETASGNASSGSVKERYHTLEIKRLGGMLLQAPRMGWILGLCCMASLGLPGLAGFWGEFPAILSAYEPAGGSDPALFRVYMVVAAIGTIFAAGYLLWLLQRVALLPSTAFPAGSVLLSTEEAMTGRFKARSRLETPVVLRVAVMYPD